MRRYILFAGSGRHGAGGYDDYIGSRQSVEALKTLLINTRVGNRQVKADWADIVDVTTMSRVSSYREKEWFDNNDMPSNGVTR